MIEQLHSFLRKHSALFALLAALAAAFAAPYLIPADPDSAIFRDGMLSAVLLLTAAFPVRAAFERHSRRSLLYGFGFAFILAFFLGIGSELACYEQLLPGMGSLIRRFAVPVMAMPLLGALCSFAFEARTDALCPGRAPGAEAAQPRGIPFVAFFLLFAVCYGAALLAYFPGILNYDFEFEISQYIRGSYEAQHPVFHSLLTGSLYSLGIALFGSSTAGAAMYSVFQILALSAMYACACRFLQRRVPMPVTLAVTACFALLPFHGILAISTVKDALFTGLCVLLCIQLWALAEDAEAFLSGKWRACAFLLTCLLMALLRHNGVFAYLPACLSLLLVGKARRKRALLLCAATLVACLGIPRGLEALVQASPGPATELLSVPCQQLARTAERADISEEEYLEINDWFSYATYRYRPHDADPCKSANFNYERYVREPEAFWALYREYAARYPRIYIEAFLENCAGLWNPDDTSHAHSLSSEQWDFVYLKSENIIPDILTQTWGEIEATSHFPAYRNVLFSVAHHARHEQIPFLSLLFRPSFYVYLLLLATLRLFYRRQKRRAISLLPIWGIFLSLLFSACIIIRYAYPIMSAVPVMLALAFFAKPKQAE